MSDETVTPFLSRLSLEACENVASDVGLVGGFSPNIPVPNKVFY